MDNAFEYSNKLKVNSYEEYLKECRKKNRLIEEKKESFYNGTEVVYDITDTDTAMSVIEKTTDSNLKRILKDYIKNSNSNVEDAGGKIGQWIGVSLTHEDYYYIIKYRDKVWYETCVSRLKFI